MQKIEMVRKLCYFFGSFSSLSSMKVAILGKKTGRILFLRKSCTSREIVHVFFSWFLTLVWIILITLFKRFLVRNMSMLQSVFIMLKIKFVEKMLKDWPQKKQFLRLWKKWMIVTKKFKKWWNRTKIQWKNLKNWKYLNKKPKRNSKKP